jgi:hypothetical protein
MRKKKQEPDTTVKRQYDGHDWIETVYSRSKQYRVVVTRDASDVYRVYRDRWDDSDLDDGGKAFWVPEEKSIADTRDRAREIANELLVATPDGLGADTEEAGTKD